MLLAVLLASQRASTRQQVHLKPSTYKALKPSNFSAPTSHVLGVTPPRPSLHPAAANHFKQLAMLVIARHMESEEVEGLRELFYRLDEDGTGTINAAQLKEALAHMGKKVRVAACSDNAFISSLFLGGQAGRGAELLVSLERSTTG